MPLLRNADTNRKIDVVGVRVLDLVMTISGSGYNKVGVRFISCPRHVLTFRIGAEGAKRRLFGE